jgi:enamine deaminase RidA (YjgF/YER057c/UK114 family)
MHDRRHDYDRRRQTDWAIQRCCRTPGSGRLLFISGILGLAPDGKLPETFEEQADQAWKNVIALFERAGTGLHLLPVISGLVPPEFLIEIEVYASAPAR